MDAALIRNDSAPGFLERAAPAPEGGVPAGVEIRSLSKTYGSAKALDDVSLQIRRGEFFSLLGPSGCGKTTLLRIIGGFDEPDAGSVLIEGKECTGIPPYLRNTNMIFQHLALFPHMNVFDNIAFGLRRKHVPAAAVRTRVAEALSLVRLEGYERRGVDQLSGGQRQRVAMARALVNQPSVLLLDEPLGALDLQLRLQMQEELRRLHRSLGNTFVFVTHDQGEAMAMSDRIAVMNAGRIQQIGTAEEIYERPLTRFVAAFVGHANLIEGIVVEAGARCIVECQGMLFNCLPARKFGSGDAVTVALRYEKVAIRPHGAAGRAGHDARIVDRTYLGSAVRFEMRLENGLPLIADASDVDSVRGFDIGSQIVVEFAEGAAIAVSE